jgi:hypothetical protein
LHQEEQADGKPEIKLQPAAASPSRLGFRLLSLLQEEDFLKDMFPPSLYLSLVLTCKHEEEARIWSISRHEEQAEGEQDRPASKTDDLRARSTCKQDRSVCVILHILS